MMLTFRPLTATLGAEVDGLDMANVDSATITELSAAWLQHKVLVVRNQDISVDELVAVHDFSLVFGGRLSEAERTAKQVEYPPQRHRVIRTHPETGQRGIYTNRAFVSHIEGVAKGESDQILLHLEMAIANPSVQCRVRWEVDTFVMWDNRSTQHNATNDFWPQERQVERVTVVGDRPV